ncbi:hypothetical protein [Undibacterium sp. Ren11W]|uniref:hypothetical protein n=1 Tax=Undibacterium sp. Ren11W TaxID=3413045 RepID=UPI003BEF5072
MNFIPTKFSLPKMALVMAVVALSACASTPASVQSKPIPRYVGESDRITQDGKQIFGAGSVSEYQHFAQQAQMYKSALSHKSAMSTNILMNDRSSAIVTREYPVGSFETSFDKNAEVIFSFQPCSHIQAEGYNVLKCLDQPAQQAIVIRKNATLKGGQVVAVQFPNGLEWTYSVLDQPEAYIKN